MIIIDHPDMIPAKSLVAGIGFFDGVHLGHRYLIDNIRKTAREKGLSSAVITFRRHPREVLDKSYSLQLVSTFEERIRHLSATGVDYCIVLDFTLEISRFSARNFLELLVKHYGVAILYVGYDHRFGHNRSEDFYDYVQYGKELDIEILRADVYSPDGMHVSSSEIRRLLALGRVDEVGRLLTYHYTLRGRVVEGHRLGRKIGFPTANLQIEDSCKVIPANGVYAVWVVTEENKRYMGMLNIGTRPTVDNSNQRSIEVNLFDFSGNLYGSGLEIEFVSFIRPERRMRGIDELKDQLQKDKEYTRGILLN